MWGYKQYIDQDVFKDDDYQVYFDSQPDRDKRNLLRQALSMGHPHGPGVDEEPPEPAESPARTDNPYIIPVGNP